MAVAADDAVDLVRRHAGLVHRLLAGQDRVRAERLVHRDLVPATVDRRVSDTGHGDLAAVLPYAEPVLVSPPLIPIWRGHGFTCSLCSGCPGKPRHSWISWSGATSSNVTSTAAPTGTL